MARGAKSVAVAAATALALLAACRGGNDKVLPTATVPTAPETTTTTAPYAVPPVIDAAYVNRVVTGLDAIAGDTTRLIVRTRTIPREAFDRVNAIYHNDSEVDRVLKGYSDQLASGLPGAQQDPGDKKSVVKEMLSASPRCMFARVERDYSAISANAFSGITEWVALRPLDPGRDPSHYNATGWAYVYEGFTSQRTQPERNPCST